MTTHPDSLIPGDDDLVQLEQHELIHLNTVTPSEDDVLEYFELVMAKMVDIERQVRERLVSILIIPGLDAQEDPIFVELKTQDYIEKAVHKLVKLSMITHKLIGSTMTTDKLRVSLDALRQIVDPQFHLQLDELVREAREKILGLASEVHPYLTPKKQKE